MVGVVACHYGVTGVRGGFVGVDVFFVISGFLITRLIDEWLRAGVFSLTHFYERRARRILPALFVACIATSAAGPVILMPSELKTFSVSSRHVATFSINSHFADRVAYFAPAAEILGLTL